MADPAAHNAARPARLGTIGAIWGVAGIAAAIIDALLRLIPLGAEAYAHPMTWLHWTLLAVWVPLMVWGEGIRGFHGSFSPMVAARARYLRDHPVPWHVVLAPLFCIGLFHATRRRIIRSTTLTLGIVALILLIRELPQPWRGIIDLGVIGGLGIGLASMLYYVARALSSERFDHSPDVPDA